ncbi:MAG TPA: methionine gamma-lyase family protein [Bacillota bacterium]|nr:methionine gamma-lyase family protein [Bacillota bacterium]HOL10615.1 methionine gamma-lyase family protein [Bacillota bacterium]HPO98580.1 methionine gamma-lyase family protein [Bacillota bacterium]
MEINHRILDFIKEAEIALQKQFEAVAEVALFNQAKMLTAFQSERIGTHHFTTSTGYGYNDLGREALERVFARVFKAEAALVRQQLVSGTHAIACAILGNLKHDDELIIASGEPYETLLGVLGIKSGIEEMDSETAGFRVKVVPLLEDGTLDIESILAKITNKTKLIAFQRSCGYAERPSLTINQLEAAFVKIKQTTQAAAIFVDNCYGEFVEPKEPIEVGADLIAGSLIKNPGGCLIPSGGYIAGRNDLVHKAAERLYAPKIGGEIGPSLMNLQIFFQGFFEAPHRVGEMLKGAILAAKLFDSLGFKTNPHLSDVRTDIIQKIYLNSAEQLINFCRAIQRHSPVESHVVPEPSLLPGYVHPVIMGGGTFISGSTSEFSADAPVSPPYVVFLQGGISYTQVKLSLAGVIEQFTNF